MTLALSYFDPQRDVSSFLRLSASVSTSRVIFGVFKDEINAAVSAFCRSDCKVDTFRFVGRDADVQV